MEGALWSDSQACVLFMALALLSLITSGKSLALLGPSFLICKIP
jgi:hypothetical protein